MKTILINNDPHIAIEAQAAGVSRIMVDLEISGKKERQASRATFISTHQKEDIAKIRSVITRSELMVRVNAWGEQTPAEIDYAIAAGADLIMLPMITDMTHVDAFVAHLGGRARPLPLVETAYSMAHISQIAAHPKIEEVFIGLNDLHLSLGLDFLFEPLSLGIIDWMAQNIKKQGKSFGFGGIATMGSGELPARRILGEHVRIGSTAVILSSRFAKDVKLAEADGRGQRISAAMDMMRDAYKELSQRTETERQADSSETFTIINKLAADAYRQRH